MYNNIKGGDSMKKTIILWLIIIILVICLVVMSSLYINMKKNAENNFNEMTRIIDEKHDLEIELNELQEKLNKENNN